MSIGDIFYFAVTKDISIYNSLVNEDNYISNFLDSNFRKVFAYKVKLISSNIYTAFLRIVKKFEILEILEKLDWENENLEKLGDYNIYLCKRIKVGITINAYYRLYLSEYQINPRCDTYFGCVDYESIVIPWDKYMDKNNNATEYVLK